MVTLQFILGRDTRTPISVIVQDESAAVAMEHFETIFNNYVRIAADDGSDDEDPGGEGGGVPGIGTSGSFNVN